MLGFEGTAETSPPGLALQPRLGFPVPASTAQEGAPTHGVPQPRGGPSLPIWLQGGRPDGTLLFSLLLGADHTVPLLQECFQAKRPAAWDAHGPRALQAAALPWTLSTRNWVEAARDSDVPATWIFSP